MGNKLVLYLHGFASSGQGTGAQYFRRKFESLPQVKFEAFEFNPTPRDFEYMTITGMINRLRQYLLGYHHNKIYFIGSSLGALVALHYTHRFAGVERMLLLAPALTYVTGKYTEAEWQQWQGKGQINVAHYAFEREVPLRYDYHLDGRNYLEPVAPPAPVLIIHGRNDEVVSIENSRQYAADYPDQTQLVEIGSDHRLNDQLDLIWEHVRLFLLS
jgi:pimeloyl-ACP methyl ester carboxylesterase